MRAAPWALGRRAVARRPLVELVDRGRHEPAGEPSSSLTAFLVVGGIEELIASEIIHEATAALPRRLGELTHLVLAAYLGERRAAAARLL